MDKQESQTNIISHDILEMRKLRRYIHRMFNPDGDYSEADYIIAKLDQLCKENTGLFEENKRLKERVEELETVINAGTQVRYWRQYKDRYFDELDRAEAAEAKAKKHAEDVLKLLKTIKYLNGMVSRGRGSDICEDAEQNQICYVGGLTEERAI